MIKCIALYVLLMFGACKGSDTTKTVSENKGTDAEIILDLQKTTVFDFQYGGFNTANLFPNFNTDHVDILKAVKQLNPRVLRFPGGSIANFYHPTGKAYGFDDSDFVTRDGSVSRHVNKMLDKNKRANVTDNYLEDFVRFAKQNKSHVLYVANITNSSEIEILNILQRFETEGIPIAGIELGNELYLNAYKEQVPDVHDYIIRAKKYALAIRKKYPDVKLLVATESRSIKNPKFVSQWNEPLAKENFYDALSLHVYPEFPFCEKTGSLSDIMQCYLSNLLNYVSVTYPEQLKLFFQQFPGKDIWITEWNILKPGNYIGNSMAQGLYQTMFYFENLKIQAEQRKIPLLSFHNLGASEFGYSAMIGNSNGEQAIYNSSYYVFSLLANCNEGPAEWINVSCGDKLKHLKYFAIKKDQTIHLYIVNGTNIYSTISSIQSTKATIPVTDFSFVSGAEPFSTASFNGYFNEERSQTLDEKTLSRIKQFEFKQRIKWENNIQPYSVNYFRIEL